LRPPGPVAITRNLARAPPPWASAAEAARRERGELGPKRLAGALAEASPVGLQAEGLLSATALSPAARRRPRARPRRQPCRRPRGRPRAAGGRRARCRR